jgi:hypothetical protein
MTYSWFIFWAIVFGLAVGHSLFNYEENEVCCLPDIGGSDQPRENGLKNDRSKSMSSLEENSTGSNEKKPQVAETEIQRI